MDQLFLPNYSEKKRNKITFYGFSIFSLETSLIKNKYHLYKKEILTKMKNKIFLFLIYLSVCFFSQAISKSLQGSLNSQAKFMNFDQYKIAFGKNYATKQEETLRRNAYKKNLKLLKTSVSQSWGVNNFTDRTESELKGNFLS